MKNANLDNIRFVTKKQSKVYKSNGERETARRRKQIWMLRLKQENGLRA